MNQLPVLKPTQKKNLLAFYKSIKPGETRHLDPTNKDHLSIINTMLGAAGRVAADYPHLFNSISKAKPLTKKSIADYSNLDKVHLVDAGKTASAKITAAVWSRSSGDSVVKGGNLLVFNGDTGDLLAHGTGTEIKNGFLACRTQATSAAAGVKNLAMLYTGHTTEADGSVRFYSFANQAAVAEDGIQANVTAPVITTSGHQTIEIAVGRTSYPTDLNADYTYIEPGPNETNPYLISPFSGNVALGGTIDLSSLTIADLSTSIFVNNGNGGTQEITRSTQYTPDSKLIAGFSTGSTPNILSWNFPYDQKGYASTQSIVYNQTSLGNEIDSFFYFAFNGIPLQGGGTAPPFFVCSAGTPGEPSINCTIIPNLYYWWHCLEKGTLVTLANGKQKPIEEINEKHRVRIGKKGKTLAVYATVQGKHISNPSKGDRNEIYQLITANGKKIKATENHVVFMTTDKCRLISHLAPGDPVMTEDGPSTVKTIKAVAGNNMFYGLALGNAEEKSQDDFPHNKANYYAGGILCGDQQSMRHHARKAYHDLKYILPHINPALHVDYTSALTAKNLALNVAAAAQSVIQNLFYVSPYSTLPPNVGTSGITRQTVSSLSPTPPTVSNPVLVVRLRLSSTSVVIGVSNLSGPGTGVKSAIFQPTFPLSATESYMLDIIWINSQVITDPNNIDWTQAVTSAPITAAEVSVINGSFNGTTFTGQLDYGPSGIGVGAQVNFYSLTGGTYVLLQNGAVQTQNTSVSITPTVLTYTPAFYVAAQTAIPASYAQGSGSFAAPFSLGPPSIISNLGGVPQAISALTAAAYNGTTFSLSWTLATVTGCVAPDSSSIQILSGGQIISTFKGGALSANIPLNLNGQSGITIQVSAVANNFSSAPISFSLITQAPSVTNIVANATTSVTATITTNPTGLGAQAYLMDGSKILAGPVSAVSGLVTFNYNAIGMVGLSVVANAVSADGLTTGPSSSPLALLATAPTLSSALIRIDPANAAQWRIDLNWNRLPDAGMDVASYTVQVMQDTTVVQPLTTTALATTLFILKTNIDPSKVYTIQLTATGTNGGASPTQVYTALFIAPTLTSLATTGNQIAAAWTAPSILPAGNTPVYQVVLNSGGGTIYTGGNTSANSAAISLADVSLPATGALLVLVNMAIGPVSIISDPTMATACSATPILTAPAFSAITAAAATNIATLNWGAVPTAASYTINFTSGTPGSSSTTSLALTQALAAGAQLGYTVQAVGTSNGVAVTGPASTLTYVPTSAATISDVRFDGSNVVVSWDAVSDALSYNVQIFDNAVPATAVSTQNIIGTYASFTFTPVAGKVYTVYVQPVTNAGTALVGASQALFSSGIFVSQQPSTVAYPYAYVAEAMANLGTSAAGPVAQTITLYLPELGTAAGALGTTPIVSAPFTIQPSGQPALPYTLTIDTTAWTFDTSPVRATLLSAYVNFLKTIETPGGVLTGATPYGISLVQAAIASALPQTFAELLYYNFGFSTGSTANANYVDLRPGMILRVSTSDYVNIPQNNLPSWINGYAGAAIMDFEIGSYVTNSNWKTGFDSFLNVLSSQGALSVSTPVPSVNNTQPGLAGAADLYFPQFLQPFYRVYFPSSVSIPWGIGSNSTSLNFTLTAAATYAGLQSTTVDPLTTATAYFRGRAIVEVMIKVMVNGNERLVPVGTSLGNLLEQLGLRPSSSSPVFKKLRVLRSVVAAITSLAPATALGPQLELRVDWNGLASYGTGNGLDAMSIPLLPGDEISTDN
ncbi:hypothetical protein BH11BAC7_BH11BAC7_11500 [soil metagenome]